MKSGVNPLKIVSNNMHVFVIDFVLVSVTIMAFALFTGIFTRPPQHEWHMYAKTPYSKQLAICG